MRLVGARDLNFSAKPTGDGTRVAIRVGALKLTASRAEAIELAGQIVAAVDELAQQQGGGAS